MHVLGAAVLGGVTYFVSDAFGITGQYGLAYSKSIDDKDGRVGFSVEPHSLSSKVRIGLTMRL